MKELKCTKCIFEWVCNWSKIRNGECGSFKEVQLPEKQGASQAALLAALKERSRK
ncbi:MAG: hypothetical protein IKF39_02160 [Oscillospiraceae bacterium]|nr:hypothetical protein [Oscillospiraceae bacterium]